MSSASDFYDALAPLYDAMTAYEARVSAERDVLAPLVDRYSIRRAIDMGCGTGIHTCALAMLGVDATGYDVAEEMLLRARSNAASLSGVRFARGDFLTPAIHETAPVDAVFCTGNAIPHIESTNGLGDVLAHWLQALTPSGRVVLQFLNYQQIFAAGDRVLGVRVDGAMTIVRFMDFTEPRITFNILTVDASSRPPRHRLQSTQLTPFTLEAVRQAALDAGFRAVKAYASLRFNAFTQDARDIVAILEQ